MGPKWSRQKLRFKYFIEDRTKDTINVILLHKTTIKMLLKADPTIQIIPNDQSIQPYSDIKHFPTDKSSFASQFAESSEVINGSAQRITLCHGITASLTLYDLKFNSEQLMPFLRTNKITIVGDKFAHATIASVGFFININPQWDHRETFAADIYSILQANIDLLDQHFRQFFQTSENDDNDISEDIDEDMDDIVSIPNFEFSTTTVRFGSGSEQMATEALVVVGSRKSAAFLKGIFCSVDFQKIIGCQFIPRGLIQMTSTNTLRAFIGRQNTYLHQVDCTPIMGLPLATAKQHVIMDTDAGENQPVRIIDAIKMATGIESVFQTNFTEKEGRWLIVYRKEYDLQVKKILDEELPILYQCLPEDARKQHQIDDFPFPRRNGIIRQHGHTMSYAQSLQLSLSAAGPVAVPNAPPRGKRAPAMLVYQDWDYGPSASKKTNTGTAPSRPTSGTTTDSEQMTKQDIADLIDSRISQKMAEATHQTEQEIKAAVDPLSQKIDRIDSTINNNFQVFAETINQNITDTITEMFQSFGMH
jgi:hypothetical protein